MILHNLVPIDHGNEVAKKKTANAQHIVSMKTFSLLCMSRLLSVGSYLQWRNGLDTNQNFEKIIYMTIAITGRLTFIGGFPLSFTIALMTCLFWASWLMFVAVYSLPWESTLKRPLSSLVSEYVADWLASSSRDVNLVTRKEKYQMI